MMILKEENELNYNISDIDSAVEDELGFTRVLEDDEGTKGYYILGQGIKLVVNYKEPIEIKLELPDSSIDLSDSTSSAEVLSTAIESSLEIVGIINRMTGGNVNEKDNY